MEFSWGFDGTTFCVREPWWLLDGLHECVERRSPITDPETADLTSLETWRST